jgi:uncharacterized protein
METAHKVATLEALEALYGPASPRSITKETTRLTPPYRRWLEQAPFFAIATSGPGGLDCSPRGDAVGGLVHVVDDQTILIPDRRGNNRLDTLRNIIADPRVGLLFLVPGINETLRINGRATLSTDPALIDRFSVEGAKPATVIVVAIDAVYFQCSRALLRSKLWHSDVQRSYETVPTPGQMLKAAAPEIDAPAYDADLSKRLPASLY